MSLKDTLRAEVERLGAIHEKNRTAYRAAMQEQREAAARAEELSGIAFVSANELAAAKEALAAFEKKSKRPHVVGVGELGAASAETTNGSK